MPTELTLPILAKIIQPLKTVSSQNWTTKPIAGINTDTRNLKPGDVFIALAGERFDGHNFVEQALQSGATAVVLQRDCSRDIPTHIPQFYVKSTLTAYQQIARWWRQQLSMPVIGITGSVGKTTTKELIAAVLSQYGNVLKTEGNDNNEIGVPKTLLQVTPEYDYAVVEMAMRAKGEIAQLTNIAQPTIGLITNVGTAHIGRLGSRQAIAEAKCELLEHMPATATAILNQDNQRLMATAATVWEGKTLTYGLDGGDLHGHLLDSDRLAVGDLTFPLPLPGTHNASNYLAAIAVARALNLDLTALQKEIDVTLPGARSRRYWLSNDIILLDETYNAEVESMMAALQLLKNTPGDRHIAVLGTMKELGDQSASLHREVGKTVAQLNLDYLFVLADEPEAREMAAAAPSVASECFEDKAQLLQRLRTVLRERDRVLFKASNSVGLDQVLDQLRQFG